MTFILNRVNQNVDTLCVMLLLFCIINFKETKGIEGKRGERDKRHWKPSMDTGGWWRHWYCEIVCWNVTLKHQMRIHSVRVHEHPMWSQKKKQKKRASFIHNRRTIESRIHVQTSPPPPHTSTFVSSYVIFFYVYRQAIFFARSLRSLYLHRASCHTKHTKSHLA